MKEFINLICVFLVFVLLSTSGTISQKTDTAYVVYESSEYSPEPYVIGAVRKLSESGIDVRVFDKDVVDGDNEVPSHISAAIEAAIQNGLPALVIMSNNNVKKVQALPKTENEIVEAAK